MVNDWVLKKCKQNLYTHDLVALVVECCSKKLRDTKLSTVFPDELIQIVLQRNNTSTLLFNVKGSDEMFFFDMKSYKEIRHIRNET